MSSGKVHTVASLLMSGGFLTGTLFTRDLTDVDYAVGALVGTVLTPDLDVDKGFVGDLYVKQRFGFVAYKVWRGIWHFYRRSVKHGSELSHFPVLGTVFRLAYLFFFAIVIPSVLLSVLFGVDAEAEIAWWAGVMREHWKVVVGLMAADTHHYIMDIATANDKFSLESLLSRRTNFKRKA